MTIVQLPASEKQAYYDYPRKRAALEAMGYPPQEAIRMASSPYIPCIWGPKGL